MAESPEEVVLLKKEGKVAIITLNRPEKYNTITHALKDGLMLRFKQVQNDNNIKVVVLTGEGKGFSAGADLSGTDAPQSNLDVRSDLMKNYFSVVTSITKLDKLVICAINGTVAGASLGFMMACDIKIMVDSAKLRYPFTDIALVPDAGSSWFLARTVGYSRAMEIIIDGERLTAQTCKDLGIVNKVVSKDEFWDTVMATAKRYADGPTAAYAATKRLLHFHMNHGLFDAMEKEADEQMKVIMGPDNIEGVMAFMQKRAPKFIGK